MIAARSFSDMPHIAGKALPQTERMFDGYIACLKSVLTMGKESAASTDDELDSELQVSFDVCSTERDAATLAFRNAIAGSGATNPPQEIALFAEMTRELVSGREALLFVGERIGHDRFKNYLTGLHSTFPNFSVRVPSN